MDLRVERLIFSKNKREVKRIYMQAFPKEERMPFSLMLGMSLLWNTQFMAFYDGDILCGLIYMATIGKTSFIMFFAVDEKLRCKGYGGRILAKVQELYPKNKIIISIEPCNVEAENKQLRLRRKNFYKRNGYSETGYFMKLAGMEQEILVKNGVFQKSQFRLFFMLYSNLTMYPKIWLVDSKSETARGEND